jgi:hypothetical protein
MPIKNQMCREIKGRQWQMSIIVLDWVCAVDLLLDKNWF